eukprot:1712119-Rhodomonas_salina.1
MSMSQSNTAGMHMHSNNQSRRTSAASQQEHQCIFYDSPLRLSTMLSATLSAARVLRDLRYQRGARFVPGPIPRDQPQIRQQPVDTHHGSDAKCAEGTGAGQLLEEKVSSLLGFETVLKACGACLESLCSSLC